MVSPLPSELLVLGFALFLCGVQFAALRKLTFRSCDARQLALESTLATSSSTMSSHIPVFYNLFVKQESDTDRVSNLMLEQLRMLLPAYHRVVYVNSIGAPLHSLSNTTLADIVTLHQSPKGSELQTLHSLWEYCKFHPDENVIYLHSKGSFTPSPENEKLRRFLTKGALSKECANLPNDCNVCSSRMSPLPHPHCSGNMWLARCSYIRNLMEPYEFQRHMGSQNRACDGSGRYAAEHWVHSHPTVRPCDLYTQSSFVWNYNGVPSLETFANNTGMALAPRFAQASYVLPGVCDGHGSIEHRLQEYQRIYHMAPDRSWWGWKFFNTTFTTIFNTSQ